MSIETVGLLASFFALVLFISPMAQIQNIKKIEKSDKVSPIMYMTMVITAHSGLFMGWESVIGISSLPIP